MSQRDDDAAAFGGHNPSRPVRFNAPWTEVPIVMIDTETTGVSASARVVEVGLARYERGELRETFGSRINPGIPIPAEASAVHGITDADVRDAPRLEDFFADVRAQELLFGAQPAAYNSTFDHRFMPWPALSVVLAPDWPWLCPLTMIRVVDRFAKGKGRHTLSAACQRHGVPLDNAHSAMADAVAAGALLYKLAPQCFTGRRSIGDALFWTQHQRASQWFDFESYLARSA